MNSHTPAVFTRTIFIDWTKERAKEIKGKSTMLCKYICVLCNCNMYSLRYEWQLVLSIFIVCVLLVIRYRNIYSLQNRDCAVTLDPAFLSVRESGGSFQQWAVMLRSAERDWEHIIAWWWWSPPPLLSPPACNISHGLVNITWIHWQTRSVDWSN